MKDRILLLITAIMVAVASAFLLRIEGKYSPLVSIGVMILGVIVYLRRRRK